MSCSILFGEDKYDAPGNSLAVEGGLRLYELEGGTEVTSS